MKKQEILNAIEKADFEIRTNMVHDHEEIMTKWMTSVENDSIWNSGFIAGLDYIKRIINEKK